MGVLESGAAGTDVLAIIEVEGSPGVPASRWMYSNREFFIDMEPAMMELVSAGVNVPEMLRFQVRMASDDCAVSEAVTGDDATLSGEVYRQLRHVLVQRGSTTMRGTLVQISPKHKAPYETKRFYSFTYDATHDAWVRRSFVGKQTSVAGVGAKVELCLTPVSLKGGRFQTKLIKEVN